MGKKSSASESDSIERKTAGATLPEKRNKGRLRLGRLIRVRPSVPGSRAVEEMLETLNVSRDGLYFGTTRNFYHRGMGLFVTYPYSSAPGAINRDYWATVVRVDQLPDGLYGVAVKLSKTLYLDMHP